MLINPSSQNSAPTATMSKPCVWCVRTAADTCEDVVWGVLESEAAAHALAAVAEEAAAATAVAIAATATADTAM